MIQNAALVTGGSRGIGRAIALALGHEKWAVGVNYVKSKAAAEKTVAEIVAAGGKAAAIGADVSASADRKRMIAEMIGHFGRIDLLVNNAGIAPDVRADILEAGEESFDKMIGTNLKAPYFLTQLTAREMIKQKKSGQSPAIVTISSVSAYAASTNRGDYCVAKAGLGMMTKLFAARLAEHGINVYEIRPGVIATDMTAGVKAKYDKMIAEGMAPIARWGAPEDVAKAVVAIAKGLLPFSTGEVINVDGGFHFRRL